MRDMNGRYAIAGVGQAPSGHVGDIDHWEMCAIAATNAVKNAGLTKGDIDGVICVDSLAVPHGRRHIVLAEHLGILKAPFVEMLSKGGASPSSGLLMAMMAIDSGQATNVLVVGVDNVLSRRGREGARQLGPTIAHNLEFEVPYGMYMMVEYALFTRRWMHEFGWSAEELAQVAVAARKFARLNPNAIFHTKPEITVDDVMESPMIASPNRRLMCSAFADGGGAFVVTSAERAKATTEHPILVKGIAASNTYYFFGKWPNIVEFPDEMIRGVADATFEAADMERSDVDVIAVPDPVVASVPMVLQSAGFSGPGEGAEFLQEGALGPDGRYKVNTHGGALSFGLPGAAAQWPHFLEVCYQLQGDAAARQVPGATVGFVYNRSGGGSQHAASLLQAI